MCGYNITLVNEFDNDKDIIYWKKDHIKTKQTFVNHCWKKNTFFFKPGSSTANQLINICIKIEVEMLFALKWKLISTGYRVRSKTVAAPDTMCTQHY